MRYDGVVMKEQSPKREGWTMEELDAREVWAEKEFEKYLTYTPEQRILFGEELRMDCYGPSAINTRLQGPIDVLERTCR